MMSSRQKTALITGATSGIGLELTRRLLTADWRIIALIRSGFPSEEEAIQRATESGQIQVHQVDLSNLVSLKQALTRIQMAAEPIDVLFNNAGVSLGEMTNSPQGRDLHFDVNTLVPYVVLMELKPLLLKSDTRLVINTTSNGALQVRTFSLDTLQHPTAFVMLLGSYITSKLALSLWTQAVSTSLMKEGIRLFSVCPGQLKTPMTGGSGMPFWIMPFRNLFFGHPRKGAVRLMKPVQETVKWPTGAFINWGKVVKRLPFHQQASEVLTLVDTIYRREYLPEKANQVATDRNRMPMNE